MSVLQHKGISIICLCRGSRYIAPYQLMIISFCLFAYVDVVNFKFDRMYTATSIGGFVALSTMVLIASLYIPSYIITTLKFRTGFLPSLRDDNFPDFRQAADNVTVLLGSVFWGILATGAFFFFIIVIPIMLIADPNTRKRSLLFLTRIAGKYC